MLVAPYLPPTKCDLCLRNDLTFSALNSVVCSEKQLASLALPTGVTKPTSSSRQYDSVHIQLGGTQILKPI